MKLRSNSIDIQSLKPDISVFVLALVTRSSFWLWRGPLSGGDTEQYKRLAKNIHYYGAYSLSSTPPMIPTIRRAPFYPYFLAALDWIARAEVTDSTVVFIQIVADCIVAVLVLRIARRIVHPKFALLAAAGYALHPGAITYSCAILSETIFTFLCVLAVAVVIRGLEKGLPWVVGIGGGVLGLAALCRPIVFPIFLIFAVIVLSSTAKRRLASAVFILIGGGIVLAPWLVRCYGVAGQFVMVQGMSSAQIYIASRTNLNQLDEATLWPQLFGVGTEDPYFMRLQKAETASEILAADRFGYRQAIQNILGDPKGYILARAKYFPHLFLSSFDMFTGINQPFGMAWRSRSFFNFITKIALMSIFSFAPVLLAVFGIGWARRQVVAILCASVWIYTLLIHLIMWVEYRFWVPVVPFLLISMSSGIYSIYEWKRKRSRGPFQTAAEVASN